MLSPQCKRVLRGILSQYVGAAGGQGFSMIMNLWIILWKNLFEQEPHFPSPKHVFVTNLLNILLRKQARKLQDAQAESWQAYKLRGSELTNWQADQFTSYRLIDDKMTRSYDSNPKLCPLNHSLTHLLTRVKSRDASASKKLTFHHFRLHIHT